MAPWPVLRRLQSPGACADRQGFPHAVPNEAPYFQSCQGFTTTTNSNYSLPWQGTLIPYWSTFDPSTWPSQHFDATTAKSIVQQEHLDISNSPTLSSKKKTPIGAIVSGVVGGVVVIVLAVGIGLFMCRRRAPKQQPVFPPSTIGQSAHFRSPSDMTMASTGSLGYTTLSSSLAHPVERSGTVRTHNTSAHPLSYFGSPVTAVPRTTLPAHDKRHQTLQIRKILLSHSTFHLEAGALTNPPLGDRKKPNGSYPVYDAPTAPPISIQSRTEPSIGSSRRARV
ncbi:uncharacterized protein LACBIDRAFT_313146 [Laccaria bicolor S238N-H82]|uniref:Predicted protein n=1 Tax=Laccaria bicolor (strain S238N-H82 / ATCC MYA-4686) TaxID=486041 RepID=B0DXM6_LACBS|nr:uncharacterized protein LACBIDRAFT_313146 [Laccaria bicolor S238N-H82]EDR00707.1 predicted protein [Laccaria bicolor S238N-H82]|eukprot:XP_001888716.1 predicted protein [Laccaria bicolor S238N-H82]